MGTIVGVHEVKIGDLTGALVALDRLNEASDVGCQWSGEVVEKIGHLGRAPSHHQVTIDPTMGLGAGGVEGCEALE
jgi:hypothetical protein